MSLLPDDALQASFSLRRGYLKELVKRLKRSAFKRLTRGAMPIFFKAKDIISTWPLANFTNVLARFKGRGRLFQIQKNRNLLDTSYTLDSVDPRDHADSINMVILVA